MRFREKASVDQTLNWIQMCQVKSFVREKFSPLHYMCVRSKIQERMVYSQSGMLSLICSMFTTSRKRKWSCRITSVMDTPSLHVWEYGHHSFPPPHGPTLRSTVMVERGCFVWYKHSVDYWRVRHKLIFGTGLLLQGCSVNWPKLNGQWWLKVVGLEEFWVIVALCKLLHFVLKVFCNLWGLTNF